MLGIVRYVMYTYIILFQSTIVLNIRESRLIEVE